MCNFEGYSKSLCCGCGACELTCPKECIKMKFDEEGFLYPTLNDELCIHCGLCKSHCPIIKETRNKEVLNCYGLIHKDRNVTDNSTSGGAFTAVAEYILSKGGVVFGCAFNENIEAYTTYVETENDLHILRGSKYVQCNTNKQYKIIKDFLDSGKYVLYCATPCQIAGIKTYLGKEYAKLILLDLICHGTPSPILFKKYIAWLGEKHKGKILQYNFRDKKYGWGTIKGHFSTETEYELNGSDPYYFSFLMGRTYRPICYHCKYANSCRTGDITIGDFWGVEMNHSNIVTKNGVSSVLINNKKGQDVINIIKNNVNIFNTSFENIANYNGQLFKPTEKYKKRDKIYLYMNKWTFERLANRFLYCEDMIIIRIRRLVPEQLKRIIRKYKNRKG